MRAGRRGGNRGWGTVLFVALAALVPAAASAQTAVDEEDAVMDVVVKLFDGMRSRDTTAIRNAFHPTARLMRAVTRDGQTTVQVTTVDQFVNSIASGPTGVVFDERIYRPEVRRDGNLATVWTFYTFHRGEQLSHCGVNAFQLLDTGDGWKIVQISDTARRDDCDPPGS